MIDDLHGCFIASMQSKQLVDQLQNMLAREEPKKGATPNHFSDSLAPDW
jgi:hypothetical protein